jgi:ribosomal protein L29
MAKGKDFRDITEKDKEKKLKELKMELIKSCVSASKTGSAKTKQIKKMIARIKTFNKSNKTEELKK